MIELDLWAWILLILGIIGISIFIIASILRTVVPPNKAHVAIRGKTMKIFCPIKEYNPSGESTYYNIPSWCPGFGIKVRIRSLEIIEIRVPNFVAFDEGRARFECDIVAFVVVKDVITAAMRMPQTIKEMSVQLGQILQATTRDSTTKKTVRQIINDRESIIKMVKPILTESIDEWGLSLKNIELVEFKDAPHSHVISDLSAVKEKEINTEMREKNADQDMKARIKEAETKEKAKMREIEEEENVAKREQDKLKLVATQEKEAKREQLEVDRVEKVKSQQIEKEQREVLAEQQKVVALIKADEEKGVAIIDAEKQKDAEAIYKEQKILEGEGDRKRAEEQAKGEAAPIREKGTAEADVIKLKYQAEARKAEPIKEQGLAEAEITKAKLVAEAKGLDEKQQVLDRFTPEAIEAMIAELKVDKDKAIGIALAKAFESADIKVLSGGDKSAFDLSRIVESIDIGSYQTANAIKNKLARPNDLGFKDIGELIGALEELKEQKVKEKKTEDNDEYKYNEGVEFGTHSNTKEIKKENRLDNKKRNKKPKKRNRM